MSEAPRNVLRRIRDGLARRLEAARTGANVRLRTRHVSGPRTVRLEDDECAVICLLKNAEYWCEAFIDHHLRLGARHLVFIDNGSTDRTADIIRDHPRATLYRCDLPVRVYESRIRALIARRAVRGGWLLFLDSDEVFAFPSSESRPLSALTTYCNARGFDAVVCQVLDFFSPRPYSATRDLSYPASLEEFDRYSLEDLEAFDYHDGAIDFSYFLRNNACDSDRIKILFGGVRHEIFGENPCLSTHRLVRNLAKIELYSHPHCSSNVVCADVTGLIRHYKFCGPYIERDERNAAGNVWAHGEDRQRLAAVRRHGGPASDFLIEPRNPRRYAGTGKLIDEGFLVASEEYARHLGSDAPPPPGGAGTSGRA